MAEQAMERHLNSSTKPESENGGVEKTPSLQEQKIDSSAGNGGVEKTPPLQEQKIDSSVEKSPPLQEQKIYENSQQDSANDLRKTYTPDRLKVPKAFKFPERYRSPTDSMMSPVTKGLLARNRKAGASLLPPSINQTKIQELRIQDI